MARRRQILRINPSPRRREAAQWMLPAALLLLALLLPAGAHAGIKNEFSITLDAREAPRGLLHAELVYEVSPGPVTLLYPKWIPGEHGPTGPVRDVVDLQMEAGGRALNWQRDPRDLYVFRTIIPTGAKTLHVALNFLLPTEQRGFSAGRSSTDSLAVLSWHYVMLYPAGQPAAKFKVQPRLILPEGWRFATALRQEGAARERTLSFRPVPLPTLIDSPVLTGRNFRQYRLSSSPVPFELHIAADNDASLEASDQTPQLYQRVVEQTVALFGSHPFERYDYLMALSDHIAQFGLEHHESSDNRLSERMLMTDGGRRGAAGMLAHELAHVWNGKSRRPADMVLENFQQPQATELLWVYEGLTNYIETLIPVRAGLWSQQDWRDQLAITAADLSVQSGRKWRSLADTSSSAQMQFEAPTSGANRRRTIDFYEEAELIWLEVDVIIRQQTEGRRSLDDFCREFFGKPAKGMRTPEVSGYSYKELLTKLNDVARYDWEEFFRVRVYLPAPPAPVGGIERAGWRLAFQPDFPPRYAAFEAGSGYSDFRHSVGMILHREDEGRKFKVEDVIVDSVAYQAGIRPGMMMREVNGIEFTPDRLREAIRVAEDPARVISVVAELDNKFSTITMSYHGGERYPYLERDSSKPDLLEQIAQPAPVR